jgi:uncharacterized membrane protein (UPF0127 family)
LGTVTRVGIAGVLALVGFGACMPAQGDEAPAADAGNAQSTSPPNPAAAGRNARPAAGTAWVIFGADTVVAEVARTEDERAEGLMYRQELPDGVGMIFVFDDNEIRSFWMQNTYVALDIAYIDPGLVVVDIQQMEPLTTDPHQSAAPAMFALEVRKGWFAEKGIRVGAKAEVVFGIR